jgi:transcriptional regulator with XRE-family HTH domain
MNKELIVEAIRDKMFTIMAEEKKKFSDTYFAEQMGLSKATLSRILNFKEIDLKNAILVCKWLDQPIDNFIKG